ncbi:MAG: hypothetical protein A2V88_00060 [Elusimicrobia bacterium RBG_16_66_12]|nr:MAG: hypothetical protein A2V88_00060 [Elusimicrobia bacterium RBG_16_66_12]
MSFLRRAARGVLTALAVSLLVLGAAELCLHALRGAPRPWELPVNFEYAYLDARRPFFRAMRGEKGETVLVTARRGAHEERFVMPKPAGTARVFVIGGSVALPYSGGGLLDEAFARLLPGAKVEAIGCGMGGYDSARELIVLREVLRYQPDLIVVMSGNNEYFGAPIAHPRLFQLAYRASSLAVFQALVGNPRLELGPTPAQRDQAFERNLREMARLASDAGVQIAFCVLPANLSASVPISTVSLPWDHRGFFQAWIAWEEGAASLAAGLFKARVEAVPGDAHAHYWLARALGHLAHEDESVLHYALAADLDRPVERTNPARARIVRRAARESGAVLVDLAAVFDERSFRGSYMGRLMRDACHWRHIFDRSVAELVVTGVARDARTRAPFARPSLAAYVALGGGGTDEREWRDLLYSGLVKACGARADLIYEESVNLLQHARIEDPARFASAISSPGALASALSMDYPQDACTRRQEPLWSHIAESLRRDGRLREAERAAKTAVSMSADSYRAQLVAALAAGRAGRPAEAADRLEALSRRPDGSTSRLWAKYWRAKALSARKPRAAR